jgi:hypothetical protein
MAPERTAHARLMPPNEAGGAVRLFKASPMAFAGCGHYGINLGQQSYGPRDTRLEHCECFRGIWEPVDDKSASNRG